MKKLIESLPFILLVSLISFAFYSSPSNAQAFIIASITGLAGFRYFQMEQIKPDYKALFEVELARIEKQHKEDTDFLKAELRNINQKYGKVALEQQQNVKKVQQYSGW